MKYAVTTLILMSIISTFSAQASCDTPDSQNGLTQAKNAQFTPLLDPSRIGSRFFSDERYTTKELLNRAFIIGASACSGIYARRRAYTPKATAGIVFTGFFISHAMVTTPLIMKRLKERKSS